uniref:Putative secreted protein n=1 Tax=Ixodes ricinus TaxID=34613 RepID=A0A6B0U740_IXORI
MWVILSAISSRSEDSCFWWASLCFSICCSRASFIFSAESFSFSFSFEAMMCISSAALSLEHSSLSSSKDSSSERRLFSMSFIDS